MTDAPVSAAPKPPLQIVGRADAVVCEGDSCFVPAGSEQPVVDGHPDANEV